MTVDSTPFAELFVGADLAFDLAISSTTIRVEATILHVYRPFTMSPVVRVRVVHAPVADLPSEAILKFYDRRCLNNIREEQDPPAIWSPEKDLEYAQWVQDLADGKVHPTNYDDEMLWDHEDMSGGRLEDWLHHEADTMYSQEVAAYALLAEFQGDLIPQLYGTVTYRDPSPSPYTVPGILIEYIPGPTMRELISSWKTRNPRLPDAELARACEATVVLLERVSHLDLYNLDVRIDNFIYRDGADTGERSPVVLIDLAQCERRGSQTDEEWNIWKINGDEIGAAGQVLLMKVEEHVGHGIWHYDIVGRRWMPKTGPIPVFTDPPPSEKTKTVYVFLSSPDRSSG